MSHHKFTQYRSSGCVIETPQDRWIIPNDCEILKQLLKTQDINAGDLRFTTSFQCHCFIKQLFLLALEDEHKNQTPSALAKLARELMVTHYQKTQKNND